MPTLVAEPAIAALVGQTVLVHVCTNRHRRTKLHISHIERLNQDVYAVRSRKPRQTFGPYRTRVIFRKALLAAEVVKQPTEGSEKEKNR